MKRAILSLILLLPFVKGQAQETLYYVEHPHSVTISTGIPYFFAMMFPPGNPNSSTTWDAREKGIAFKSLFPTNLNVGYNYQFSKRWEVAAIITVCGYVYSSKQYPKTGEDERGKAVYDWNATPTASAVHYQHRAFIPSAMLRYYWLARKSSFQMYSAAGLGITIFESSIPVCPTLTPLGMRFGGKHWYGQVELTVGTTATLFLGGVGYRF